MQKDFEQTRQFIEFYKLLNNLNQFNMKKIITLALISIITSNINAQFDATNMTFSDGERYIMNKWTPKNGKTSDFMKAAG